MGNFLTSSSIGRKLIMSVSGCFLILFVTFHLAMNITAVFSESAYNWICELLGANWYALAGSLVLAAGVLIHIIYAVVLTLQNRRARGNDRYAVRKNEKGVAWSSKNMFVLGLVVAIGILLHLWNFWYNMQFQEILGNHVNKFGISPTDGAGLIRHHFAQPVYCIIYIVWFVALWFHLTHGFWSMFQSVGWANKIWLGRLKAISNVYVTLLVLGFIAVVVVFYFRTNCIFVCG